MAEQWKIINVSLRNEDLEAWINVPSPGEENGSKAVFTPEDARTALRAKSIVEGSMDDEIEKIFSGSSFGVDVLVARGIPPEDGEEARIQFSFRTSREFESKEDKDGRIDYREVFFLENVQKGQELCRRFPPTEGTPGRSVLGREIKAQPGQDRPLPKGPGTEQSRAGGAEVLIASINGCVSLNKDRQVEVQPRLVVKGDVDYSTGNINFNGSLTVGGDIKAGFKVEVTGDLEVAGAVEDAEVKAGGSALIKKGFIGYGKGQITTAADLTLKFAQNQKIHCGGNLILGGEIMHCNARVGGNIIASGRKGAIIGGHVKAEGSVEVPQIGSESNSQTVIEAGCDFKLEDRKIEIQEELSKINLNMDKVKSALYKLSRLKLKLNGTLPAEQDTLYGRLLETVNYYPKHCEELKQELLEINRKLGEHCNARIKVTNILFPRTKLIIAKFPKVFNEKIERATFLEVGGEITRSA